MKTAGDYILPTFFSRTSTVSSVGKQRMNKGLGGLSWEFHFSVWEANPENPFPVTWRFQGTTQGLGAGLESLERCEFCWITFKVCMETKEKRGLVAICLFWGAEKRGWNLLIVCAWRTGPCCVGLYLECFMKVSSQILKQLICNRYEVTNPISF